MKKGIVVLLMIGICVFCSGSMLVASDTYPTQPLNIILAFGAGGTADLMTRALQPSWENELGVPISIENLDGAGGQVAWTTFLKRQQDGYSIVHLSQPHFAMTLLTQNPPYKLEDFYCFAIIREEAPVLNVLKDSPWNGLKDMIEAIKAHPNKYAIGCTRNSGPFILANYLKKSLGLEFALVPYSGGGEGRASLLGGHVDAYFGDVRSNYSIQEQVKCLGIGGDKPNEELWPGTKTFNEQLKDYGISLPYIPYMTGYGVSTEFKNKYPERFKKLVETYSIAFHTKEHAVAVQKTKSESVTLFYDVEDAQQIFSDQVNIVKEYWEAIQ